MTRDEVMAMTDEQLKFKCAKILGIESWRQDGDGNYIVLDVPDYPNDIAAAWGLIGRIIDAGYSIDVTPGLMVRLNRMGSVKMLEEISIEATFDEVARFVYLGAGLGKPDATAITRAFILAMEPA